MRPSKLASLFLFFSSVFNTARRLLFPRYILICPRNSIATITQPMTYKCDAASGEISKKPE